METEKYKTNSLLKPIQFKQKQQVKASSLKNEEDETIFEYFSIRRSNPPSPSLHFEDTTDKMDHAPIPITKSQLYKHFTLPNHFTLLKPNSFFITMIPQNRTL
jgi:hypothetical protein